MGAAVIITSLAAVVVAFALLVDNKRNRTDLAAYRQALSEYMESFFKRLAEIDKAIAEQKRTTSDLARVAGQGDKELEDQIKRMSESAAQTVDNSNSAMIQLEHEVSTLREHLTAVQEATLMFVAKKKKANGRAAARRR